MQVSAVPACRRQVRYRSDRPVPISSKKGKPRTFVYPIVGRNDLDSLKRVLVPTPTGAQVPISLLAEISNKIGPPSIRNENAQLVGFVFVDITTADIGG